MPVAMNPPSTPRTSSTFFRDIAYEYPAWRSKQPAAWLPRLHGLEIVYRELLHVGRVRKPLVAEPVQARHEPLAHETVERLARLPKIDHAPTTVDRAGRVDNHPLGRVADDLHHPVGSVVVLLRPTGELESDAYSHLGSPPRVCTATLLLCGCSDQNRRAAPTRSHAPRERKGPNWRPRGCVAMARRHAACA